MNNLDERRLPPHKLPPGKLNKLQEIPYPSDGEPLDPRYVWFLLQLRRGLLHVISAIESIVEAENKRY